MVVQNVQASFITLYKAENSQIHDVACRLDQGVFRARSQNFEKATINFVMSVRPSA